MSESQRSNAVLLVRPAHFGFHAEAAASNAFAKAGDGDLQALALAEFEQLARELGDSGVEVLILEDSAEPEKPDAIFPNNWVSFHADGTMVVYPMATEARRIERDVDGLTTLLAASRFDVRQIVDLSFQERHGHFLEGTGSLILDRPRRRAYANSSPRTDAIAIADFDDRLDYSTFIFDARSRSGQPIYHTNVLMGLGTSFAILCTDAVTAEYRDILTAEIDRTDRTLIEVDYEQMCHFACNLIELESRSGSPVIALSSIARRSFRPEQLRRLESFGELLDVDIPTIESVGGGSVRCMIADIHLPRR